MSAADLIAPKAKGPLVKRLPFDPEAHEITNPYIYGRCLSEARAATPSGLSRLPASSCQHRITIAGDAA